MFCSKCGKELEEGAKVCPQCGEKFNNAQPSWLRGIVVFVGVCAILTFLLSLNFLNMDVSLEQENDTQEPIRKPTITFDTNYSQEPSENDSVNEEQNNNEQENNDYQQETTDNNSDNEKISNEANNEEVELINLEDCYLYSYSTKKSICGVAKNNTNKNFTYVFLTVYFYDDEGFQIDERKTYFSLEPFGKRKFDISYPDNATKYKIKSISTSTI